MKKTIPLIPLFRKFIKESETGRRLKKNGERIRPSSIRNYANALKVLERFTLQTGFDLRLCDASKLTKREYQTEKNYWKKFYRKFTCFLYQRDCHDNYVGNLIKLFRTFIIYLRNEKDFPTGEFYRLFYVRKEEIEILVLSLHQLKYFIHDKLLEQKLTPMQRKVKDIFVFGCATGLRFSDIFRLTNKNFVTAGEEWYLKLKSHKTKTFTQLKLPPYAVAIYQKYNSRSNVVPVFNSMHLKNFNDHIKNIGEKACFTAPVELFREKQGKAHLLTQKTGKDKNRFCDCMSSHMMRRTAITTLLILGMPEHLVRKISGHSYSSASFNRYVHYAQAYIDKEIDKVHLVLEQY